MIAKNAAKIKNLIQENYNKFVDAIDFTISQCQCKSIGQFVIHGYYDRKIRTNGWLVILLVIQRMKCKSCGKTHAVLPTSIVPYSQILLTDMIGMIISHEEKTSYKINKDSHLTRKDVKYVIKQYLRHWRDRILAIASGSIIEFLRSSDLTRQVHCAYNTAFMQVKRCSYLLSY